MINNRYKHVVFTFDSKTESITMSFVESDSLGLGSSDSQSFKIVEYPFSDLQSAGAEKAKEFVGKTVLSTMCKLGNISNNRLCQEDVQLQEEMIYLNSLLLDKANKNDPDAQSFMAYKCMDDALEKLDAGLLEISEEWFKKAEKNGNERSAKFLRETWPKLKEDYRKRIDRDKRK